MATRILRNAYPNGDQKFAKVIKSEEKGSDVNIAIHLLNDAWLDNYDCAVLVSNDSDLAEALRLVKTQHKKLLGHILPCSSPKRRASKQLQQYMDFTKHIRQGALKAAQLPDEIPGTAIKKPLGWY